MVKRNIVANYLGQGWAGLIGLVFVPLYIKFLGIEAYGIIGFFITLQAWFALLDFGMSPTISREMSRYLAGLHSNESIRELLRSLEWIFFWVAIAIGTCISIAAPWIASDWLQGKTLSTGTIVNVLIIIGWIISLRWISTLYRSALIGLHKHILLNFTNAIFASIRAIGSAAVLMFAAPSITAFFFYQGIIYLIECLFLLLALHRSLPASQQPIKFKLGSLIKVWRFAAGMSIIAILATFLMQVDKVILSKIVSLSSFGTYILAGTVANALYLLIMPISQVMRPRLAEMTAKGESSTTIFEYHRFAQFLTISIVPAAFVVSLFSDHLLLLWTRDVGITSSTSSILSVLIIGTMLNGLMNSPYALQIAHGNTRFAIWVNIIAVIALIPSIYYGVSKYGTIAAAIAWLVLNIGYIVIALPLLHRSFFPEIVGYWYRCDVGIPMLAATVVSGTIYLLSAPPSLSKPWSSLFLLISSLVLSIIATALSTPHGRSFILNLRLIRGTS